MGVGDLPRVAIAFGIFLGVAWAAWLGRINGRLTPARWLAIAFADVGLLLVLLSVLPR